MNYKNFMGLVVVSTFALKGLYRLNQYYNYESDFNNSLADVAKDGIDSLNDLARLFSDSKHEIELCENVSKISKYSIDYIIQGKGW